LVALTPAGKETLSKLRSILKRFEKEFFAPLDAEDRKTLHTLLRRVAGYHDQRLAAGGAGD
jgi:DNA-binding MarR family transcriptional regulator